MKKIIQIVAIILTFMCFLLAKVEAQWDISTASFANKQFSVATQETASREVFFKPDGTMVYILGSNNDKIYQYTLGTAWDISTATFANKEFSVATQDLTPLGLFFKPDGTTVYLGGATNDKIYQYTLSTAWDISTATFASKEVSVVAQDLTMHGLFFKPDGTTVYTIGSSFDKIYQYTLSTAWDISTATFANKEKVIGTTELAPTGLFFKPDGTTVYFVDFNYDKIYQWALSTAWDISTATFANKEFSVATQEGTAQALYIKDGTAAYIVGSGTNTIYQYSLSSASCTDADSDGVCVENDCNDNNNAIGAKGTPNASCNDSNANTTDDYIAPDSCACLGYIANIQNVKWVQDAGVTVSTNTITKTAATGWNNAGATSNQVIPAYQNGFIQFRINELNTEKVFAFSYDSIGTGNQIINVNFGIKIKANNLIDEIFKESLLSTNQTFNFIVGDSIRLARSGSTVLIYHNRVLKSSINTTGFDSNFASRKLRIAGILNTNGATIHSAKISGCADADVDGLCVANDCNDNNASIGTQQAQGTACNDGNASTTNDVIQSDQCTCAGVPDTDQDGVPNSTDNCVNVSNSSQTNTDGDAFGAACDCNDNNASIGTQQPQGTACNDGNALTINDVIQSNGCTCAGTLDCNIDSIRLKTIECFNGGHQKYSNVITTYFSGAQPQSVDIQLDSLPYMLPIQKFYNVSSRLSFMTFDPNQTSNNVRVTATLTGGLCVTNKTLTQTFTYTNATCNN